MSTQAPVETSVRLVYQGKQRCEVTQKANGKTLGVDCPYSGGGQEFSPGNLVAAGLAGCMSLSVGALAQREGLDIAGMKVDVGLTMIDRPESRIGEIAVTIDMPKHYTEKERTKLERAVEACPIKHSFRREIPVATTFNYPARS